MHAIFNTPDMPAGKSDNDDYDDWMAEIHRKSAADREEKRQSEMRTYLALHCEELLAGFHALSGDDAKAILMGMVSNDLLYSLREQLMSKKAEK